MKSIEHAQRQRSNGPQRGSTDACCGKIYPCELSPGLREEYEEHFLLRRLCSEVKAAAAFVDNAGDVLRQPSRVNVAL